MAVAAENGERKPVGGPGLKPFGELRQHKYKIRSLAWSPDGKTLATGSDDETIGLMDLEAGGFSTIMSSYYSEVNSVIWSPDGGRLLATTMDGEVHLIDVKNRRGQMLLETEGQIFPKACWINGGKNYLTFDRNGQISFYGLSARKAEAMFRLRLSGVRYGDLSQDGRTLALATADGQIALVDLVSKGELGRLPGRGKVIRLSWAPRGNTLVAAMDDTTVRVWNLKRRRQDTVLEGHLKPVISMGFSHDGRMLATQDLEGSIRIWRTDTWQGITRIQNLAAGGLEAIAFHPRAPILATTGGDPTRVRIWSVDARKLLQDGRKDADSVSTYRNAKVVLVGDSGVGKSGLALRLLGKDFAATESTHGRYVYTFNQASLEVEKGVKELRETLLWDLAGQPGYRLIHQLHLDEVAVAMVVFDCKNAADPFGGISHWDRALETARHGQGGEIPLTKLMVAARVDRGSIAASQQAIEEKQQRHGFKGYFETSSREGWGIDELRQAVIDAVPWDHLPQVRSTRTLQSIKKFLLAQGQKGRLLVSVDDLYAAYLKASKVNAAEDLREEFQASVRLLESRDILRRMSFGDLVLLRPEYLDAYASAIVEAATGSADATGRIKQDAILNVEFRMSDSERIADRSQERLLLMATIEDLLRREIALRQYVDDDCFLMLPSQLTRANAELGEGAVRFCVFEFDGPVTSIYATLAVRVSQCGLFERYEMWRNGAQFQAENGDKYGLIVSEPEEGHGEIILFAEADSDETLRLQYERFVENHLTRWVSDDSYRRREQVICGECGTVQPEDLVIKRRELGRDWITCGVCDAQVSIEAAAGDTQGGEIDLSQFERMADRVRDHEVRLTSAVAEMSTRRFAEWAEGDRADLTIVFTDVVGSTRLYEEYGDDKIDEVMGQHFNTGREFLNKHNGFEIKTMGDAFMVAFKETGPAFDFMLDLHDTTGHELIKIRASADAGNVRIRENDAFGGVVNYAARLQSLAKGPEIWISERVKAGVDDAGSPRHRALPWRQHHIVADENTLKGFTGEHEIWQIEPQA